jgi:hypothetical protein
MKKFLFIAATLVILTSAIFLFRNAQQRAIILNLANRDSSSISRLDYKLYLFGLIPVGKAVIFREKEEDYQGQKVYHLRAAAETSKALAIFFSAQAEVDSFVDPVELNPFLFKQRLTVKGKYDTTKEVFYDQRQGIMTLAGVKRVIPYGTKDPLAAMLYLKRASPEALKDFQLDINTNQKTYLLKGSSEIKEVVVNKRPYQAMRINADIRRRDKNPYHRSSITMFLLRSRQNFPYKINVFAGGVYLEAALTGME